MALVSALLFTSDAVLIEYQEEGASPFPIVSTITVPYREAQNHPQLSQDLQEVIQDVEVLLDSVKVTRLGIPQPVKEMGRE